MIFSTIAEDVEFEADMEEKQICEVKRQQNDLRHFAPQCIAQAITFSLYKSAKCLIKPQLLEVTLVPTIAITPQGFDVYFYDSKYDILLRNCEKPIPLWQSSPQGDSFDKLRLSSVLQLWMLLHYGTFGPRISEKNKIINSCQLQEKIGREKMMMIYKDIDMKPSFRAAKVKDIKDIENIDILDERE